MASESGGIIDLKDYSYDIERSNAKKGSLLVFEEGEEKASLDHLKKQLGSSGSLHTPQSDTRRPSLAKAGISDAEHNRAGGKHFIKPEVRSKQPDGAARRCVFCGRKESEAAFLLISERANICSDCIKEINAVMEKRGGRSAPMKQLYEVTYDGDDGKRHQAILENKEKTVEAMNLLLDVSGDIRVRKKSVPAI